MINRSVSGLHAPKLNRRQFTAAGTALTAASVLPRRAYAADPHRFSHGAFDITVLSDGSIMLPAAVILPDAEPDKRPAILERLGGTSDGAPFYVNIPLIRTGNDLILVDVGSGNNFQASAGRLASNLQDNGIDPSSITKVIFTHVHPDHSGATVTPYGEPLYRNADYFVSEAEWNFWMDPNYESSMPAALHDFARGAQRDLSAIEGRVTLVRPDDEVISGMRVLDTRGHTPGHISVELSGPNSLVIAGDVVTSNIVFFENPEWHFGFDTEPDVALRNRKLFLDRAAAEGIKMLGYHWMYPGVGYAERRGGTYQFIPSDSSDA